MHELNLLTPVITSLIKISFSIFHGKNSQVLKIQNVFLCAICIPTDSTTSNVPANKKSISLKHVQLIMNKYQFKLYELTCFSRSDKIFYFYQQNRTTNQQRYNAVKAFPNERSHEYKQYNNRDVH